jgi:hypothetical protein
MKGFWPELIIIVGFLGIITRIQIQRLFPEIEHLHIDIALILFIFIGTCIVIYRYFSKKRQRQIEILEYKDIAKYNASGHISGSLNGTPIAPASIENWSDEFLTREDGHLVWTYKDGAKEACEEVIAKLPKYPFSYYFLALYKREKYRNSRRKEEKDSSWPKDADVALSILEETTSFEVHHNDHDLAQNHLFKIFEK